MLRAAAAVVARTRHLVAETTWNSESKSGCSGAVARASERLAAWLSQSTQ